MLEGDHWYLLGMGPRRRKMLYRAGRLSDLATGETIGEWNVRRDMIVPRFYSVFIETAEGANVAIIEDDEAVWLAEHGDRRAISQQSPVNLPEFEHHPFEAFLRSLHQEVLVNITPAGPCPNLLVYDRPRYRDAAMACMVLSRTGNLHLVRDWILSLREPFDRHAGEAEADNLGQLLYMISLVADASHPLVDRVLAEAARLRVGDHIRGRTDFAEHAVYQTKWLKFGLAALGLDDPYEIPHDADNYSSLFWMDYRDAHQPGGTVAWASCPCVAGASRPCESALSTGPLAGVSDDDAHKRPYLAWADAHFHNAPPPMHLLNERWPLTWEADASQARYESMAAISHEYVDYRVAVPHAWHAAEALLYLIERTSIDE